MCLERSEAQVANLDHSGRASDENVVALEIAMNDRRFAGVQKVKAVEQLSGPFL